MNITKSIKSIGRVLSYVWKEAQDATYIDKDEDLYRPISQDTTRDLLPIKHSRQLEICYKLWLQNPLAKRLVAYYKNFTIGNGVKVVATETKKNKKSKVQEIIDSFWNDEKNNFDQKLPKKVEALSVFGEQFYPAFVNDKDGRVRIGYIDPSAISKVITNPENVEEPLAIKIRPKNGAGRDKVLKIIKEDEDPASDTYGRLVGDVFYFSINNLPNSQRGYSDILANADWLDGYDQFLFNMVERSNFLNAFVWDVTIDNATDPELKKFARENGSPKPGSIRVHNDKVKWDAVTPDLKASDAAELFKMFRTQIIGSMGFPLHWFGDGSDANLATAHEMGWPTMKALEERQNYIRYMITTMVRFAIDQAIIKRGSLKEISGNKAITDESFEIVFPELTTNDITKVSTSFQQIMSGLMLAKSKGWLTNETAMKMIAQIAQMMGIEIDVAEEMKKVEKETELENAKDYDDLKNKMNTDPNQQTDDE